MSEIKTKLESLFSEVHDLVQNKFREGDHEVLILDINFEVKERTQEALIKENSIKSFRCYKNHQGQIVCS